MDKRLFGKLPNGEDVYIYRLTDGATTAEIMKYGAAIQMLLVHLWILDFPKRLVKTFLPYL